MRGLGSCVLRSSHSHSVFEFSSQSIRLSLGVNCIWMDIFIRWLPKDLLSRPHLRDAHTQQIQDSLSFLNSNSYISGGRWWGWCGKRGRKCRTNSSFKCGEILQWKLIFDLSLYKCWNLLFFNGDSKTWAGTQINFIMEEITLILE